MAYTLFLAVLAAAGVVTVLIVRKKRLPHIQKLLKRLNKESPKFCREIVRQYVQEKGLSFEHESAEENVNPTLQEFPMESRIVLTVILKDTEPWEFYRLRGGKWVIVDHDTMRLYERNAPIPPTS